MSGQNRTINYGALLENATMSVLIGILRDIEAHGSLPSRHYFYITFDTTYPGVILSDSLKQQYPHLMTIVLQRQFWDLKVEKDHFRVTLSFDHQPQELHIPFSSILRFSDPSVNFSLRFRSAQSQQDSKRSHTTDHSTLGETVHLGRESSESVNLVVPFPKVAEDGDITGNSGDQSGVDQSSLDPNPAKRENPMGVTALSFADQLTKDGFTKDGITKDRLTKDGDHQSSSPSAHSDDDGDDDDGDDDDTNNDDDTVDRSKALVSPKDKKSVRSPNVVNLADFRAHSNPENSKD